MSLITTTHCFAVSLVFTASLPFENCCVFNFTFFIYSFFELPFHFCFVFGFILKLYSRVSLLLNFNYRKRIRFGMFFDHLFVHVPDTLAKVLFVPKPLFHSIELVAPCDCRSLCQSQLARVGKLLQIYSNFDQYVYHLYSKRVVFCSVTFIATAAFTLLFDLITNGTQ